MRNNMVTTLAEDYIRMGRAKGLSNRRIMLDYAARNAILPNLSGFAMSLGFVVSGSILVEFTFNYPGVGYMLLSAVSNQDYPADAGAVRADHRGRAGRGAVSATSLTVGLDPRARTEAEGDDWRAMRTSERVRTVTDERDHDDHAAVDPTRVAGRPPARVAGAGLWRASVATARPWSGRSCWSMFIVVAAAPQLFTSVADPNQRAFDLSLPPSVGAPAGHHVVRAGHLGPAGLGHPAVAAGGGPRRRGGQRPLGAHRRLAAYLGGAADDVLSLLTDVFLVLPDASR